MLHACLLLLLQPQDDSAPRPPAGRAPPTTAWAEAVGERERRLRALGPGLVNEPLARTFLNMKNRALAQARALGANPAAAERAVEEMLRKHVRARARARAHGRGIGSGGASTLGPALQLKACRLRTPTLPRSLAAQCLGARPSGDQASQR
jgi:hypothetical protein